MKIFILILLSLFILSGCSTSSLILNKDKELVLKYSTNDLLLTNKLIDSRFLNFKDLFVTIYKLKNENGRILFYEEAKTELDFEFVYGGLYSVMYIFDDRQEYEVLYKRNNLSLVQLKLKDSSYLNVMIQASDSQVYSYVYGFSNEEFVQIAQMLKINENDKLGELKYEALIFSSQSKALSTWTDEMVFFTPLIMPLRVLGVL
ncbi:hypothetical protein [Sulfurimonas sp.]|uniref:hypothetical protein n=1 Tax=Sulfurimonas sp. TaxID=2022749 RepID=UPI0025DB11FA|nr:hypothetical protein [Sulfurimonas sp.]